ncbi:hypothetical protein B0H17DRAFT_1081312 [Mycena rosella]|uniref:Neutral/alkaline non-lysosomal ceramidase N-terminal domain-containing protein n=1 Tax=Mycena rosella TaxID=1033263 RepID=A0AAD7D232_MYCRO|nr:hypothetical protein B0H17DRAFT_1081312 [Mycena rosella]
MLSISGELSTMAGRRIREAVRGELISSGILREDAHVVVAGPPNTYAHHIMTREKYKISDTRAHHDDIHCQVYEPRARPRRRGVRHVSLRGARIDL